MSVLMTQTGAYTACTKHADTPLWWGHCSYCYMKNLKFHMHRQCSRLPSHLECCVKFCALGHKEHIEPMECAQHRASKVMKGICSVRKLWELGLVEEESGVSPDVCKYLVGGDEAEPSPFPVCPLECQWAMGTNGNTPLETVKTWLDKLKCWSLDSNQLVYVNSVSSYSLLKRILIWMAIIVLDQDFVEFCMCAEHLSCSFFPSLSLWMSNRHSTESMCFMIYTIQCLLLIFFTIQCDKIISLKYN